MINAPLAAAHRMLAAQARYQWIIDAVSLLISKAAFIGLRVSLLYLLATKLNRSDFGTLSVAFTISEISRYVGDWGTDLLSLRRFSVPDRTEARTRLQQFAQLRVLSIAGSICVAFIGIFLFSPPRAPLYIYFIPITSGTSLALNYGINWLQANNSLQRSAAAFSILGITSFAVQYCAFQLDTSIGVHLALLVAFEMLMSLSALRFTNKSSGPVSISRQRLKEALHDWMPYSTPIAIATMMSSFYGRFDQLWLSRSTNKDILGDYSLAARLIEPFFFFAGAFGSTAYVKLAKLAQAKASGPGLKALEVKIIKISAVYSITAAALIQATWIFKAQSYFPSYVQTPFLLCLYYIILIVRCLNMAFTASIQAQGGFTFIMRLTFLNVVSTVVSVVIFTNYFGAVGAALGTITSEIINSTLQLRWLHRSDKR